jgi:hypothetical protein
VAGASSGKIKEQAVKIYAKGDRVSQPQYGPGTIAEANSQHTVIEFDQHGTRTFVTSLVVLEATTEPAPMKTRAARRVKRPAKAAAAPSDGATATRKA